MELKVGEKIESTVENDIEFKVGNCMPLSKIPLGSAVHNIELKPGQGAVMVRSAGAEASIMAKEERSVQVKFPSGEVRLINANCRATIGKVGNVDHDRVKLGFAGASRHRGIRPSVRGTAMNAVDHPHGGGRGKSKNH